MQKWNAEKGEYEPYSVPEDWDCPLFCADMQRVVNCASCGKKMIYGDGYTSQEIHNSHGLGYTVCQECHQKEMKRRMERAKAKGEVREMRLIDADKICKHGYDIALNEIGEVVVFCEIFDAWRNVTLGDCMGNCKSEELSIESEE